MAIHIPEDKLSEIRNTANILDVISERVVLKRAGKDHVGLCPFHSEKTPSFTVSSTKQIFHCFGCGAGGDVFSFLMKYDGISFSEAAQSLARRYGIDLPDRNMSPAQAKAVSLRQQLFDLNREVMGYYTRQLMDPAAGKQARAYLADRGFSPEMIARFSLGFAPDGWDHLVRFFRQQRVSLSLAEQTGLVVPRKSDGFYDRFRNRVIFPIIDMSQQVIGFGGRVMDDSRPKYLNSPETPVYNKSRSLYGAPAARTRARETGAVYIVEGYFDLMALHQHDISNAVATLGTALTADHVQMLKRGFAQKAYLVFDSDEAGLKAAKRSVSLFLNAAMDAAVIVLPKGYDPDSFVFEFGQAAFMEATENALPMIAFLVESAIKSNGLSMEGKLRIISELQEPLMEIQDRLARSIYIQYLAERLGVRESAIRDKLKSIKTASRAPASASASVFDREAGVFPGQTDAPAASMPSEMIRVERQIVSMMLNVPEILPEVEKRNILAYFSDERLCDIARAVLSAPVYGEKDRDRLFNRFESQAHKDMIASLLIRDECRSLDQCELLLCQFINGIEKRENTLLCQIQSAQEKNDDTLLFELLRKKQEQSEGRLRK